MDKGGSNMPSQADEIRAYALDLYVRPWRRSKEKRLSIRAGDVVRGMRLHNATPNVCSAIGGAKFQDEAGLVLVHREGPRHSTTTTFHYESAPATRNAPAGLANKTASRSNVRRLRMDRPALNPGDGWRNAGLCLVSCVSVKQPSAAPAKDLYTSAWFQKARACVETLGRPWYILSAKHGLLDPASTIDPYDETLKTMPIARRRHWARGVITDLAPHIASIGSVTLFAGTAYREFLEPELRERGIKVHVPMQGMPIGKQLSWLSAQTPNTATANPAAGRIAETLRFYTLLAEIAERTGGYRRLKACNGRMSWPRRGVYFFFEDGENRNGSGPGRRVVRVGTHALTPASRTTLWSRLSQHRGSLRSGTGNHRTSIFRLIVGAALARRGDAPMLPS